MMLNPLKEKTESRQNYLFVIVNSSHYNTTQNLGRSQYHSYSEENSLSNN